MSLPTLPAFYNMLYTDEKGNLSTESLIYNDQLFQTLNELVNQYNGLVISNVVNEKYVVQGFTPPSATSTEITAYGADTNVALGTMWFDTTISKLKVKTAAGTIETITSA